MLGGYQILDLKDVVAKQDGQFNSVEIPFNLRDLPSKEIRLTGVKILDNAGNIIMHENAITICSYSKADNGIFISGLNSTPQGEFLLVSLEQPNDMDDFLCVISSAIF